MNILPQSLGKVVFFKTMNKQEYYEYLKSTEWKLWAYSVKRKRGWTCEVCGIDNQEAKHRFHEELNVHHKNYKNLGREKPEDVLVLCARCHLDKHSGVDFFGKFKDMKDEKIYPASYLSCKNCGAGSRIEVRNVDELFDWYCPECS